MIKLLIRKFVKNYEHTDELSVRSAYGQLAGSLGIGCNLVLFVLKLCAGLIVGSMAVISDAFNNLSDMGASIVSLIGTAASGRRADEEHPFGHGRSEYIGSLIVSFLIILVGFELFKSSVGAILRREMTGFSWLSVSIMFFSIVVKLWMFAYNHYIGQKIQSPVLRATAQDSLHDVYATTAIVSSLFIGQWIDAPIDGIMGLAISILIVVAGYGIAKDTITVLLGAPPDPMMAERICQIILEQEGIEGVHDLIIHDYGPGRCMASVHAEVPVMGDIVKIHEIVDITEKKIQQDLGVHIVIHIDPIMANCEQVDEVRRFTLHCVHAVNPVFGIHDFRMTDGEQTINLIFDLEVPYSLQQSECDRAVADIQAKLKEREERYNAIIQVDRKK
ncbi:MAG: cation transporter [Ruminococcaceae bacterium]|nr:cation transporter [Oscillospiraceae bacterium]